MSAAKKIANIEHIWWDLDGTVYKTPPEFEAVKFQRRFELYSDIIGKPINEKLKGEYKQLYKQFGSHSAVFVSLGKDKGYWQRELEEIDLMPYIKQDSKTVKMFQRFKELPYLHSIFTNRRPDYGRKILKHLGIPFNLFKNYLTNADIARPKPYLDGYKKMVKLSGLRPKEILFVGDRIETDILPAKKIGLKTALVWSEKNSSEADYTFKHVGDVISIFS